MAEQYTIESLREKIKELEDQQAEEGKYLKNQMRETIDKLRPINIIKSLVSDVVDSKSMRNDFVNTAAGYVSGLITKKLVVGNSNNPAMKLLGLGIHLAMTTVISKNAAALKEVISQLAGSVFAKIQEEIINKSNQPDDTQPD